MNLSSSWRTPAAGLLLLLLLRIAAGAPEGSDPQAAALLQIRSGFTNGHTILADWGSDPRGPCNWRGVGCDSGDVMYLHLDGLGLQGSIIPEGWASLQHLAFLTLARNALSGTLPSGAWLPQGLQQLDLSRNAIRGQLSRVEFPRSLEQLCLGGNSLSGPLPLNLPVGLGWLELQGNPLTGGLPGAWNLPYLTYAALYDCQLSGTLPAWDARPWAQVVVLPQSGGAGFCGKVPDYPPYYVRNSGQLRKLRAGELPSCGLASDAWASRESEPKASGLSQPSQLEHTELAASAV